jgi:hypothetical protein
MNANTPKQDDRTKANFVASANTTVRFSAPDRTVPASTSRPGADDDDAQWVTERMFDHYNG